MTVIEKAMLYGATAFSLVAMSLSLKDVFHEPVAYVDIGKLVENYKFKKDLEEASGKNLYKIKGAVDSLVMLKKVMGDGAPRSLDSQLSYAQYAFNQYYTLSNQDVTKKVWDRLNPLMAEFGKAKGLELLVGANGAGTVLYGSKRCDVTDELIQFINTKYGKGSN